MTTIAAWLLPRIGVGFGLTGIKGYSITSVFPEGSEVFVLPLKPSPGDYVFANAKLNGGDTEDMEYELVIKLYDGEKLVSTDIDEKVTDYQILGVVVGYLPTHKLIPGRNTGPQVAEFQKDEEKTQRYHQKMARKRLATMDEYEKRGGRYLEDINHSELHDFNSATTVSVEKGIVVTFEPASANKIETDLMDVPTEEMLDFIEVKVDVLVDGEWVEVGMVKTGYGQSVELDEAMKIEAIRLEPVYPILADEIRLIDTNRAAPSRSLAVRPSFDLPDHLTVPFFIIIICL